MVKRKIHTSEVIMIVLFFVVGAYLVPILDSFIESKFKESPYLQESSIATYALEPVVYEKGAVAGLTFSNITALDSASLNSAATPQMITSDPRILAMRKFLINNGSPMYPYADVFIVEADRTGLDWRLVASISGVESGFGNIIPYNSNNAWGWRGGPGGNYSVFPTWREGITTVTNGLAYGYGTKLTPYQIEGTYCPPCGQDANHSWANGVQKYMNDLNYYLNSLNNL